MTKIIIDNEEIIKKEKNIMDNKEVIIEEHNKIENNNMDNKEKIIEKGNNDTSTTIEKKENKKNKNNIDVVFYGKDIRKKERNKDEEIKIVEVEEEKKIEKKEKKKKKEIKEIQDLTEEEKTYYKTDIKNFKKIKELLNFYKLNIDDKLQGEEMALYLGKNFDKKDDYKFHKLKELIKEYGWRIKEIEEQKNNLNNFEIIRRHYFEHFEKSVPSVTSSFKCYHISYWLLIFATWAFTFYGIPEWWAPYFLENIDEPYLQKIGPTLRYIKKLIKDFIDSF